MNDAGNASTKIADEQKRLVEERRKNLDKMTAAIETVLVDGCATWRDWNEIVNRFNDRNDHVMPELKIEFIRERFNNPSL